MPKSGLKIQIVDDEVNVARTLQMVLQQEAYQVICAYSAREALLQYKGGYRPDAAIIDLNMERDDIGLEVVAVAQKLRPRPIIIISTGYANLTNVQDALNLRVDYLATKPVELEELRRALTRLLQLRGNRKAKKKAAARG